MVNVDQGKVHFVLGVFVECLIYIIIQETLGVARNNLALVNQLDESGSELAIVIANTALQWLGGFF